MPEMIKKSLIVTTKEIAPHILELVGSSENLDRDGELIKASGWQLDNYRKNPVVLWAHDYRQPPIGKTIGVEVRDGRLVFRVEFAPAETYPFADVIYNLYKGGFLNAASVGFIPLETEGGKGKSDSACRIYLKQELLELSAVPVPSNPDALTVARTQGLITVKEFEQITGEEIPKKKVLKAELIQLVEEQEARIGELEKQIADLQRLPEEKPYLNEHACRIRQPSEFQPDSFRRMKREHEGKEYSIIMGRLKGEDTMTEQAYRYPKDTWTEASASSHCKSHKGSFEAATEESEAVDVIIVENMTVCQSCREMEHQVNEELANEEKESKELKAINAELREIAAQAWANAMGE